MPEIPGPCICIPFAPLIRNVSVVLSSSYYPFVLMIEVCGSSIEISFTPGKITYFNSAVLAQHKVTFSVVSTKVIALFYPIRLNVNVTIILCLKKSSSKHHSESNVSFVI